MMTINSILTADTEESTIKFMDNTSEMLRITKDGFYVRGKRVNQDDKEAEIVYNTFHQWLTWSTLNRKF